MVAEQSRQLNLLEYLDAQERETLKPGSSVLVDNRFGVLSHYITTDQGRAAVVHLEAIEMLDKAATMLVPLDRLRPAATVGDKPPEPLTVKPPDGRRRPRSERGIG